MRAGGYGERFQWLKWTAGTKDTVGQRTDTYPSQGYLWGVAEDLAGGRETVKGSEKQVTTATVRLRNYPAVVAGDRLVGQESGLTWTVNHVVGGDNEVLCDVQTPAWSAGGGTAE